MMRPLKVLGNPLSAMNRTNAVFLIWGSLHLFFLDICVPPGDKIKFKYSWRIAAVEKPVVVTLPISVEFP